MARAASPPEMLGMTLAHFGLAVFFFGVLMTESASIENGTSPPSPGRRFELRGYDFRFDGVETHPGPELPGRPRHRRASLATVRPVATLHPEKRSYASGGQVMTEAAHRRRPAPATCTSRSANRWATGRQLGAAPVREAVHPLDLAGRAADGARRLHGRVRQTLPPPGGKRMMRRLLPLAAFAALAALLSAGVRMNSGKGRQRHALAADRQAGAGLLVAGAGRPDADGFEQATCRASRTCSTSGAAGARPAATNIRS